MALQPEIDDDAFVGKKISDDKYLNSLFCNVCMNPLKLINEKVYII